MNSQSRFAFLNNLPGKIYRQQPGRITKAIQLDGEDCFVKLHFGVGLKEIVKNLSQARLPILGAKPEYLALKKLAEIGVASLEPLEFGQFGINPSTQHSYIVTKALKNTISLEDLCVHWSQTKPDLKFKRQIIRQVAQMAGLMHAHGINHRDFYICHFLFDEDFYAKQKQVKLYLIDLHRAQIRQQTPLRWQLKDIAGIYFSSLNLPLTRRDLFCFMHEYQQQIMRHNQVLAKNLKLKFWFAVEEKAWLLYEKTYFKKFQKGFSHGIFDPNFSSEQLQQFLVEPDHVIAKAQPVKDDATTTVVKTNFAQQAVIIKRYHVRDFAKGVKRLFKGSRARRCWLQALRLRHFGIETPKPIAMLERWRFGLLRESYVVTEYLSGQDLKNYLTQHPEKISQIAAQMKNLFKSLALIHTAHGDTKATNLWLAQQQIYLLDLDGMHQYLDAQSLQLALAKDRKRFLKNWQDNQKFYEIFSNG